LSASPDAHHPLIRKTAIAYGARERTCERLRRCAMARSRSETVRVDELSMLTATLRDERGEKGGRPAAGATIRLALHVHGLRIVTDFGRAAGNLLTLRGS